MSIGRHIPPSDQSPHRHRLNLLQRCTPRSKPSQAKPSQLQSSMRILHTSDWHLGQYFLGHSRQTEHQKLIEWLVEQTRIHHVDAVLIAGDIFDTGAPPSYARELYNRLVLALREAGVGLTVLAGNHDSVAMLQESRDLLALLNTFVMPSVQDDPNEQVQVLTTRDGAPGAIVCAIPFIRPRDVLMSVAGENARDKQASLQDAIHAHYQALFALAVQKRAELGVHLPIVATGHLTTVGASASESVREIYVGSLEAFPTAAFPAADYIALGHIHRPQKVGGLEHIRYSGSPIALSFDEARQTKQMLLVDVSIAGTRCRHADRRTLLPAASFGDRIAGGARRVDSRRRR